MARFNDHPPRSIEYKLQAIEDAVERDAAPFRDKNMRERCYSEEDIATLAQEHAELRYMRSDVYDTAETGATRETYQFAFRNLVRRSDQ